MPQLDLTTFSTQFFWLIIFFSLFYLIIAKILIPNLNRIYKLREQSVDYSLIERSSGFDNSLFLNAFYCLKESIQAEKQLLNIHNSLSDTLAPLYTSYLKDGANCWFNSVLKENIFKGRPKKASLSGQKTTMLSQRNFANIDPNYVLAHQQQVNLLRLCLSAG